MEPACVRHTELPGTTRLFADFMYHFDRVQRFYSHPPHDFAAAAREVEFPEERRRELVAALRELNGDSPLLDRLAQPGTVAIVTGQQAGLFSGPAYTVYKALTAVKIAASLEEQGIAAVPVFWVATEDHDFEEVARAWAFGEDRQPVAFDVAGPSEAVPVGGVTLDAPPVDALEALLAGLPFGSEAAAMAAESYRPGVTLGSAFRSLVERVLGDHKLLFVDPMHPAFRQLAAPALRDALAAHDDLSASLIERGRELEDAGYHAQVHFEEQTSLVFALRNGRRIALKRKDGRFVGAGVNASAEELAAQADALSPNALLRPMVQDSMLPTAVYIGGPAELAYFAQTEVIYRRLGRRMPNVTARAGFTLFDARAAKVMARYGLVLRHFFDGAEPLRARMSEALIPKLLRDAIDGAKSDTSGALTRLSRELAAFDPSLDAALGTSRRKIEFQLGKIEAKIRRESVRRDERASADAARLSGLLYPHDHLQERFYSILPFLATFGPDLVDRLYEAIDLGCPDHRLLVM